MKPKNLDTKAKQKIIYYSKYNSNWNYNGCSYDYQK